MAQCPLVRCGLLAVSGRGGPHGPNSTMRGRGDCDQRSQRSLPGKEWQWSSVHTIGPLCCYSCELSFLVGSALSPRSRKVWDGIAMRRLPFEVSSHPTAGRGSVVRISLTWLDQHLRGSRIRAHQRRQKGKKVGILNELGLHDARQVVVARVSCTAWADGSKRPLLYSVTPLQRGCFMSPIVTWHPARTSLVMWTKLCSELLTICIFVSCLATFPVLSLDLRSYKSFPASPSPVRHVASSSPSPLTLPHLIVLISILFSQCRTFSPN
jgi:hypothetical protein